MKIGFIGLGIMGTRMAENLMKAGHQLVVYNRTQMKARPLVDQGAELAGSPADVAKQVDILFTMLGDPQAVEAMALGEWGFLKEMSPNSLWVDSSTVNPSFSRRMAEEANQRQVRFVDAPVAGSKVPAEKGELLFLVGGADADVKELQPLFDLMGSKTIHAGENGMGTSLKMVFNLLLGEIMLAFSEGLVLGQSLGLERGRLFDILSQSAVVAPFTIAKRQKIEEGEYGADFPLQWMQKDLQLASQTAYERSVALPGLNEIKEIYALAMQNGLAGKDFSAIYSFLSQGLKFFFCYKIWRVADMTVCYSPFSTPFFPIPL